MPVTKIEVKQQWSSEQIAKLIDTVHAALVQHFKIPEHDRLIRVMQHRPDYFITPPGTTDNYTLVEISLFPGRSLEAKKNLYQAIVTGFSELGIAPNDVRIILYEISRENWGIRGGQAASEVDLGFEVKV